MIDLQQARHHHLYAIRLIATRPLFRALLRSTETGAAIWEALDDIPALCDETDRLRSHMAALRLDHANLLAAVHATLSAAHDGEHDPLAYLRDELPDHTTHAPGAARRDGGEAR
ncbi:hypothetical protein J5X84_35860 [Streptosporangiaceae bacterium NEAU-GS5]|nr:hypothetical protein [Streptosporangiaceae bacterium NEAU-GS5]